MQSTIETIHPLEQSQTTPLGIHPYGVTKHNHLSTTPKTHMQKPKEKTLKNLASRSKIFVIF
jgi:hypothetical protein